MIISLRGEHFSPYEELQRYQEQALKPADHGATACFVGTMRDVNEGETVYEMRLEHYPGMTEKHLERIVDEARNRWNFIDALVIHRIGEIHPDDPIVLVAIWSSHRGAAFDACRYIMEELKSRAPFWKKEATTEGTRWVDENTSGY
ncbi:MAG TPA: molybdenum cofactor biosynthesis protein MoaE [Methylococcaceae bacterium]|nr:molybdenum cofactor biosynthesis protein MoaE [Methylococcaceae bacterium]